MASVTIRHVPDETRDELVARAARSGQSLQEYLLHALVALVDLADRPSPADWAARVRERKRHTGAGLTTEQILDARDAERR